MTDFLKRLFNHKRNTDEIKVKVSGGQYFIADLESLSKSKVVQEQVRQAKTHVR